MAVVVVQVLNVVLVIAMVTSSGPNNLPPLISISNLYYHFGFSFNFSFPIKITCMIVIICLKMSFIQFSTYNKSFKHIKHKHKMQLKRFKTYIIPTRLPVAT